MSIVINRPLHCLIFSCAVFMISSANEVIGGNRAMPELVAGFNDYLTKPLNMQQLLSIVNAP